eukprot:353361-Chlamydomonas_euryale.AAC.4
MAGVRRDAMRCDACRRDAQHQGRRALGGPIRVPVRRVRVSRQRHAAASSTCRCGTARCGAANQSLRPTCLSKPSLFPSLCSRPLPAARARTPRIRGGTREFTAGAPRRQQGCERRGGLLCERAQDGGVPEKRRCHYRSCPNPLSPAPHKQSLLPRGLSLQLAPPGDARPRRQGR